MPNLVEAFKGRGAACGLFAFTIWQSFFTTGIVYGWPALLLVLKKEGVYANKCGSDVDPEVECNARSVALNLVFTLGAMTNILGGVCAGWFGSPKVAMMIGLTLVATGSFLFGLADASSQIVWPIGYLLMGVGGGMTHLPTFCLGNAFGSAKGGIIACFVGCFCASTLTFQIMYLLYMDVGLARRTIFLLHGCLECLHLCITTWLWPHTPVKPGGSLVFKKCKMEVVSADNSTSAPMKPAPIGTILKIASSRGFLCFIVFHTSQLWFNRCVMGWLDAELKWRNENALDAGSPTLDRGHHLSTFTMTQATIGLTVIPVFGVVVAKWGHNAVPFLITGVLSVIWLTFFMIPGEWPLYVVYVFCSWHRQFFFSTFFNYLASEFPAHIFPKLTGLANFGAGLASGTQTPLLQLTLNEFGGDFLPLNTFMLCWATFLATAAIVHFVQVKRKKIEDSVSDNSDTSPSTDLHAPPKKTAEDNNNNNNNNNNKHNNNNNNNDDDDDFNDGESGQSLDGAEQEQGKSPSKSPTKRSPTGMQHQLLDVFCLCRRSV